MLFRYLSSVERSPGTGSRGLVSFFMVEAAAVEWDDLIMRLRVKEAIFSRRCIVSWRRVSDLGVTF